MQPFEFQMLGKPPPTFSSGRLCFLLPACLMQTSGELCPSLGYMYRLFLKILQENHRIVDPIHFYLAGKALKKGGAADVWIFILQTYLGRAPPGRHSVFRPCHARQRC